MLKHKILKMVLLELRALVMPSLTYNYTTSQAPAFKETDKVQDCLDRQIQSAKLPMVDSLLYLQPGNLDI
ncbi:hypothetical protein NHP21005_15730 [Helicobacter sp. NHP21005]|nr:hypothetical protein NHP21005_15730 [Helicobacter sp. NHP21005]